MYNTYVLLSIFAVSLLFTTGCEDVNFKGGGKQQDASHGPEPESTDQGSVNPELPVDQDSNQSLPEQIIADVGNSAGEVDQGNSGGSSETDTGSSTADVLAQIGNALIGTPDSNPSIGNGSGGATPLVLDFSGRGLISTATSKGASVVWFDINDNGIRDPLSWVAPTQRLLAIDLNGNGVIESGAELFGGYLY